MEIIRLERGEAAPAGADTMRVIRVRDGCFNLETRIGMSDDLRLVIGSLSSAEEAEKTGIEWAEKYASGPLYVESVDS